VRRAPKFQRDAAERDSRTGFVDLVLPPHEIAREIRRIADHPYIRRPPSDPKEIEKAAYRQADDLGRVFLSLKKQMGVDFSAYKETTLLRRIQRRMALHRIDKLNHYARFLRDNKKEIEALFDDLLINVTRFFRDKAVVSRAEQAFFYRRYSRTKVKIDNQNCASGCQGVQLAKRFIRSPFAFSKRSAAANPKCASRFSAPI